jgi:hypothetical protein
MMQYSSGQDIMGDSPVTCPRNCTATGLRQREKNIYQELYLLASERAGVYKERCDYSLKNTSLRLLDLVMHPPHVPADLKNLLLDTTHDLLGYVDHTLRKFQLRQQEDPRIDLR